MAFLGISGAAGLVWWGLSYRAEPGKPTPAVDDAALLASGRTLTERAERIGDVAAAESSSTSKPSAAKAARIAGAVRNRAKADQLRAALGKFWQASEQEPSQRAATAAASHPRSVADWTQGDYVKSVLHDQYIPLARECYEEYLVRAPKGAGKVVVNFSISGTAELGGVIENVTLGEESTVKDEPFATCLAESMYALALDPPPEDSKGITVGYGVEFSPESPEEHARRESGNQGLDAPDEQPHNTKHR